MYQQAYRFTAAVGATVVALATPPALRDIVAARADVLEYGLAGLAIWGLLQVITALLRLVESLASRRHGGRGDSSLRPQAPAVHHVDAGSEATACGVERAQLGFPGAGFVAYEWSHVSCAECLRRRIDR